MMRKGFCVASAGFALLFASAVQAASAPKDKSAPLLSQLIIGLWEILETADFSGRCGSDYWARYLPDGIYEDSDGRGFYRIVGQSAVVRARDSETGALLPPVTSVLVSQKSRDQLVFDNGSTRYGLLRC